MLLSPEDVERILVLVHPAAVERAVRLGAVRREAVQRHFCGVHGLLLRSERFGDIGRVTQAIDVAIRSALEQGLIELGELGEIRLKGGNPHGRRRR